MKISFSKKNLLAIFAGFIVIILLSIIINIFSFIISLNIAINFSPQNFKPAFNQQPYLTYIWLLRIISYLSLIVGGFVVGKFVKKEGWIYGAILGVIFALISIANVVFSQRDTSLQILQPILTVIFTGFGGYLGEVIGRKNSKN